VMDGGQKKPIPINAGFLLSTTNAQYIVCMGAAYFKSLAGACGSDVRGRAGGYNAGPGWCGPSKSCAGMTSCAGGPMKSWECLWENRAHRTCNNGLQPTREYAPKVAYCATH